MAYANHCRADLALLRRRTDGRGRQGHDRAGDECTSVRVTGHGIHDRTARRASEFAYNTLSHIMKIQTLCTLLFLSSRLLSATSLSPLYERGYVVMPEPPKVALVGGDFRFGPEWRIEVGPGVSEPALMEELESRFHLKFNGRGTGGGVLRLKMAANSVAAGPAQDKDKNAIAEQAYKIDMEPNAVTVSANVIAGLFYSGDALLQ